MIKHLGIRINLNNPTDKEVAEILDNVPPYISKSAYTKKALLAYGKKQDISDEDKIVEKIVEKLKLNGLYSASESLSTAEIPKKDKKSVSKRSKKELKEQEETAPAEPPVEPPATIPVTQDDDEIVSNLDPDVDLDTDKMESVLEFLNG